jgi:hypothetical protein
MNRRQAKTEEEIVAEPQNENVGKKLTDEDDAPEVIAHDAEEDPWCAVYSCGSLAPD